MAPTENINDLQIRNDVYDDEIPDELPEQGSYIPQLRPGQYWLRVPANVAQLWKTFDQVKDTAGQPLAKPIQRLMVRFSKEAPLTVVGGEQDGAVLVQSISNMPRKRSKKADVPPVSDMTYLIRNGFADNSPLKSPQDYINVVNAHAGDTFPAETGLQGQCRDDKVRWISDNAGGQIEDPTGTMGCGKRYYTQAFQQKDAAGAVTYAERVLCSCGALVRGFAQIDRFIKNPGQGS